MSKMKEISLDTVKGKEIKSYVFGWSDQMVITFTDNTFICLGVDYGYDHGDGEINTDDFDYTNFDIEELEKLGIMTEEEAKVLEEKRENDWQEQKTERERKLYLELKEKYEKGE